MVLPIEKYKLTWSLWQPQCKKTEDANSDGEMQTLKANCKHFDNIKIKTIMYNLIQDQREAVSLQLMLICDKWM